MTKPLAALNEPCAVCAMTQELRRSRFGPAGTLLQDTGRRHIEMHLLIPTAGILLFFAGAADVWPHVVLASAPAGHPTVTVAGGCKSVATFTASAAPVFRSAGCVGCHGGAMPGATTSFDLANLGKDDVAACAQALKKVDVGNKPASAIFQAATGSLTHAGGKVTDAAGFTRAVHGWIDNE